MSTTTLLVRKDALAEVRSRAETDRPLADGQVRIATDCLALTANNITYAAYGDSMDYWRFFPSGEEGWGVVPVWGFGNVVQSLHPGVAVGERLYGYWPLASSAVLQPDRLNANGFRDAAPHRSELHAVYNQYLRCQADPFWRADTEGPQALLRPLFTTSWLIDDLMADNAFFGATQLVLSSASSKTAYGTAFLLSQRKGIEVVGLTSPGNRSFCEGLGCYARVVEYDHLTELDASRPCVYIDFAGNAAVRQAVHGHWRDQLRYSCVVGGTHVGQHGGARGLAGPRPTFFFAPAQAKKRQADWGPAVLQQRLVESWHGFLQKVLESERPWLQVRSHEGAEAARQVYQQLLGGRSDPREGHVLRLS